MLLCLFSIWIRVHLSESGPPVWVEGTYGRKTSPEKAEVFFPRELFFFSLILVRTRVDGAADHARVSGEVGLGFDRVVIADVDRGAPLFRREVDFSPIRELFHVEDRGDRKTGVFADDAAAVGD